MDTLNLQMAKESFQKVLENPTNDNKYMFVYYHKLYIETIMKKLMHKDYFSYEDLISAIMTHLYKKIHLMKFDYGYTKCKNLLSTMTTNYCINVYVRRDSKKRIPESLCDAIIHFEGTDKDKDIFDYRVVGRYQSIHKRDELMSNNISETVLHKIDLIKTHATKFEREVIDILLEGYTFTDISKMLGYKNEIYCSKLLNRLRQLDGLKEDITRLV